MIENIETDVIDIGKLLKKIYSKRKLFYYRVWPITFVVSSLLIICVPRYYTSEIKLAPELGSVVQGGTLNNLASTFGIDLGNRDTGDAINPLLYPDLLEDNKFVTDLFSIHVKSVDGEIDTDYYTYLKSYQKTAWWNVVISWVTSGIKSLLPSSEEIAPTGTGEGGNAKSPYWLSKEDNSQADKVRANIGFSVDKQSVVITIATQAQDPLIAKTLADSVQEHLQDFITDYRTNKARVDERHYQQLYEEAEEEYLKSCDEYVKTSDTYKNVVLNKYQVMLENMEKDMAMKYLNLQTVMQQLQKAKAKVQENTPAFTVIKGASVAQKPAGPKRMMFVIGMLMFATVATMIWVVRKDIKPNQAKA